MTEHGTNPPPGGGMPPPQGQPGAPPPAGQPGGPPPAGQPGAPPPGGQPGVHHQQQPPAAQGEGLQPPVANLLSYLFGLIGGLIMYFTQRHPEVRFHAAQSILMSIGIVVLVIVLNILTVLLAFIDPTGVISSIVGLITFLVFLIGIPALVIVMCIQGYQQKHVKLPLIGNTAEQWAAKQS